jgi:hypothetical protein
MMDTEITLRLFKMENVSFVCRPTHLKSDDTKKRVEYMLEITADDRLYVSVDLTDDQRKQLLLALNRGPKNEPVVLLAGHDT